MVKKRKDHLFCHVIFQKVTSFVPRLNIAVIFRVTSFVIYGIQVYNLTLLSFISVFFNYLGKNGLVSEYETRKGCDIPSKASLAMKDTMIVKDDLVDM